MSQKHPDDESPTGFASPYFALGLTFAVLGIALAGTNAAFLTFGFVGLTFLVIAFSGDRKKKSQEDEDPGQDTA